MYVSLVKKKFSAVVEKLKKSKETTICLCIAVCSEKDFWELALQDDSIIYDIDNQGLKLFIDLVNSEALCNADKLFMSGFIKSIPPEIVKLNQLSKLSFSSVKIKSIPEEISLLENLECLDLSFCGLSKFPPEILSLSKLKDLDISCNEIEIIPKEICKLSQLKDFKFAENKLKSLPHEIFQLPKLHIYTAQENSFTPIFLAFDKIEEYIDENNKIISNMMHLMRQGSIEYFKRNCYLEVINTILIANNFDPVSVSTEGSDDLTQAIINTVKKGILLTKSAKKQTTLLTFSYLPAVTKPAAAKSNSKSYGEKNRKITYKSYGLRATH